MVGGTVIEITPTKTIHVYRYWCVDRNGDECAVHGLDRPDKARPVIGDQIWWQSGTIYFDGDKKTLIKVGNSYQP